MSCAQRANRSEPAVWPVLSKSKPHSPYREYDIYAGQLARTFSLNHDTEDCPIEHEKVCDLCHRDIHVGNRIGAYERKQGSEFYLERADEYQKEENLEAALADCYLSIHMSEACDARSDDRRIYLPVALLTRAGIHVEIGNVKLSEDDFETIETLVESGGILLPSFMLQEVYQQRGKMYENLGCHDRAERDYQKAQEAGRS